LPGLLNSWTESAPSHEVVIVISVTGSITGEVMYSMGFNMVTKIAETLMFGLTEKQIMNEYKDIVGEIANMITGNAMIHFDHSGKLVVITTPTVFNSKDFSGIMTKKTTLSINLYSPLGQLEMNVSFK